MLRMMTQVLLSWQSHDLRQEDTGAFCAEPYMQTKVHLQYKVSQTLSIAAIQGSP